jgi:hypothetical protein
MDRRHLIGALIALPLVASGAVIATTSQASSGERQTQQATADGYVCPATGETLPCPKCCPLNK